MAPAPKSATYQDIVAWPEDGPRVEVIGGDLVALPMVGGLHGLAHAALCCAIGGPFDDDDGYGGPGGWWIFVCLHVELGPHDIVRPDLVGVRRERLPDPDVGPLQVVPDWIGEIVSPSNERHDRVTKRRLYAQHGVPFYWLLDPKTRLLEALELRDGRWSEIGTYDETHTARIRPFDAIELPVGRLFIPRSSLREEEEK